MRQNKILCDISKVKNEEKGICPFFLVFILSKLGTKRKNETQYLIDAQFFKFLCDFFFKLKLQSFLRFLELL